ncbi:MAG: leucine-rich repeat protein [Ruminococcus sp.]|nr:leucine-rich repeat protein [Ruminococcus sp.]
MTKRRILAAALAVTLVFGAGAVSDTSIFSDTGSMISASAADEQTYGFWRYTINNNGTVTITKYTGLDEELTIPSKIAGREVVEIGKEAFCENSSISKVTIPSSVTTIGNRAFAESSLQSITVPSTVTVWGTNWGDADTFIRCKNLTTVTIHAPSVPNYCFKECSNLKTVTLGSEVTSIAECAFYDCNLLSKITLGGNVTSIGNEAFYNCYSLSSIDLGKKLDYIGYNAFRKAGLKSVTIPASVSKCDTSWDEAYTFAECPKLTSVTCGTAVIARSMFYNCPKLQTVSLPNARWIEPYAFDGCGNLTTVTPGKNLYTVCDAAFRDCSSLKSINLGHKLYFIGCAAFQNTGLTSVIIPSSVCTWGSSWDRGLQFADCPNLATVKIGNASNLPVKDIIYNSPKAAVKTVKNSEAYNYAKNNGIAVSTFTDIPATSIKLNKSSYTVHVGETLTLNPLVAPVNTTDNLTWTTGDDTIATVKNSGEITGKKTGLVAIKVKTKSGKSATCQVNVVETGTSSTDSYTAQSLEGATVESISNKAYTGSAIKPDPAVTLNTCTRLVKGEDYTISYSNNTNVGTATLKITGKGAYKGTITKTFKIVDVDLAHGKASIPYSSYTYRGRGIKPSVKVYNSSGTKLTKNTDYTLSYSNNTKAGTATITIKGKGKYTGSLKKTFTVKKLDISTSYAKISIPYSSYTYTGSAIKPTVKVKFKDGDVIPSTDYSVSYSNNTKVGKATITITGKSPNLTGTYKKTFVIKPKPGTLTLSGISGGFKASWTKNSSATGYEVKYSKDKNFKSGVTTYDVSKNTTTSVNFTSKPKSGEPWYVKYRAYVAVGGTKYGNYSAVKSVKAK